MKETQKGQPGALDYTRAREKMDAWGKKYYTIGGNDLGYADTEDSDFKAIARNSISITPLHLDWTNYASFETLLKRRI